jgi:hypothetical protein
MARAPSTMQTTITPILRHDGTVHFQYAGRPLEQRLCEWTAALLWLLTFAVIVTVPLWI